MRWVATYENGGHECLVVHISHPISDPLSNPPGMLLRTPRGTTQYPCHDSCRSHRRPTLTIGVGPLYQQPAQVGVTRADTNTMKWLYLVTNSRTDIPTPGAPSGDIEITSPIPIRAGVPNLGETADPRGQGLIGDSHPVNGDGDQVGFITTDGNPGGGNGHVYRVSGIRNGQTFGGYTVLMLGS